MFGLFAPDVRFFYAHFKHLVASCASLHSKPHTLAPHLRHFIVPQYPQLSQNCLCGGPPAGGGATWLAAYDKGGAASSASSSAGFNGGGIERSIDNSASSLPNSRFIAGDGCGIDGPGVASEGVCGMEANVLWRRRDCAVLREPVAALRGTGACCCCASCASSSSSQCLIWRWYCMILRVFCVFGIALGKC
jgi:hypothetical protein